MPRRSALAVALFLLVAVAPSPAGGQTAGSAVPSGTKVVTVDLGPGSDAAFGLAVQPDGRTVVVGTSNVRREAGGYSKMAVLRFLKDGGLDPTFGDGGRVLLDEGRSAWAQSVAVQPDGRIVVVGGMEDWGGEVIGNMAVTRLDPDGRRDPTFNGGQVVALNDRVTYGNARHVTLQPDGKLIVTGVASPRLGDFDRRVSAVAVLRLTPSGALDGSFGDRGLVRTDLDGWEQYDVGVFAAVRPDGRIVVAGTTSSASASGSPPVHQIMVQYTAAGALDPTFGNGGIVLNPVASSATAAVMKPNGTVVTTGDVRFSGGVRTRSVVLTAYRSDGALDTRFGAGGSTVTHAPAVEKAGWMFSGLNGYGEAVALDARGRLVVAGMASGGLTGDLALVRYNGAGGLDASFGQAGWARTGVADYAGFTAVGVVPTGGIVAAGHSTKGDIQSIVFALHPAADETATADGWGWNALAQVGDGATVDRPSPTPVAGPTGASSLAAGAFHSLALGDGGTVSAWGWNGVGQIGDGTTTDRQRPVQVAGLTDVSAVAAGYYHSLAVAGGTVKAWGWNPFGQLGDGTVVDRNHPVSVAGLTGVMGVSAGTFHSLAVRNDGTVWAWGWNGVGQLGDGTTTDRRQPVMVPGLKDVIAVSAGAYHSLALTIDGSVWAWGWNPYGQLGDGSTTDRHTPVWVHMRPGVSRIAAGGLHSLALKNDGKVWAWGWNGYGELGDGTTASRTSPLVVADLPPAKAIAAGFLHSVAIRTDGRVESWGWNGVGQLGDGTAVDRHLPVVTGGPGAVEAVAAGLFHSLGAGP